MLTKSDLQKIKQIVQEVTIPKEEASNFSTKNEINNFSETLAKCKDEIVGEIRDLRVYIVTSFFEKTETSS
ncbi:hypothetical protein HYT02_05210 [Candidatus Gottesmanbacteria bacterium]|nr:hypothetical protein [Candidatus Gottesmanbacteria bacterium]